MKRKKKKRKKDLPSSKKEKKKEEKEEKKKEKKDHTHPPTFSFSPYLWWRLWGLVSCGTFESLRKRRNNQNHDIESFKDHIQNVSEKIKMDAKRKDLKTFVKEGRVNIDPGLVDELLDEAVQKLLDEYAEKAVREQQTAAVLTTMGTMAETFAVRGAAQLASDISNNPPILENITSGKNAACSVFKFGPTALFDIH